MHEFLNPLKMVEDTQRIHAVNMASIFRLHSLFDEQESAEYSWAGYQE